jgi:hypothetical protein
MRPSSSASIACIASPAWSGFNRFYQHLCLENADHSQNLPRPKKKDPAQGPGLLANSKNLAMVMTMVTTMMMGRGVSRKHRPSQNDERDGSKK